MSEMTQDRLRELRRIAEAATPGPWWVDGWEVRTKDGDRFIASIAPAFQGASPDASCWEVDANARHIATFDPPTVLAMLDRIEALEYMVLRLYQDTVVPDTGYCHRCGCRGFHDETCAMAEVEELLGLAFEEDDNEWDDE